MMGPPPKPLGGPPKGAQRDFSQRRGPKRAPSPRFPSGPSPKKGAPHIKKISPPPKGGDLPSFLRNISPLDGMTQV